MHALFGLLIGFALTFGLSQSPFFSAKSHTFAKTIGAAQPLTATSANEEIACGSQNAHITWATQQDAQPQVGATTQLCQAWIEEVELFPGFYLVQIHGGVNLDFKPQGAQLFSLSPVLHFYFRVGKAE